MTDDIVTRLRHKYAGQLPICAEAADEIERLREKNEWLESHVGALVIGFRENKAEIERLKRSIQFSAGIISTYTNQHPEEVLNYLKEEGGRNG